MKKSRRKKSMFLSENIIWNNRHIVDRHLPKPILIDCMKQFLCYFRMSSRNTQKVLWKLLEWHKSCLFFGVKIKVIEKSLSVFDRNVGCGLSSRPSNVPIVTEEGEPIITFIATKMKTLFYFLILKSKDFL